MFFSAIDAKKVQGWSCGLKIAQSSCVNGIPEGVEFNEGETIKDPLTCFCSGELCNEEHFCDSCTVGTSGAGRVISLVISTVFGLVLALFV